MGLNHRAICYSRSLRSLRDPKASLRSFQTSYFLLFTTQPYICYADSGLG